MPLVATLLERVRATPGVQSAAFAWGLPFEGNSNVDGYLIQGRPTPSSGNEGQTYQIAVSPGYFATLGIPLLYGRDFIAADDTTGVPVAIVDESIARKFFTGTNARGKRIRVTGDPTWTTIVGVVGAIHDDDATQLPGPHMYVSLAQQGSNSLSLAVRTRGSAAATIPSVRSAIAAVEPSIPLEGVRALTSVIGESFTTRRIDARSTIHDRRSTIDDPRSTIHDPRLSPLRDNARGIAAHRTFEGLHVVGDRYCAQVIQIRR